MKSLYSVLGVSPDASPAQIEMAYAELLSRFQDGTDRQPGEDATIRLIAAKEAYAVLSNPDTRQLYNQKLFAPATRKGRASSERSYCDEPPPSLATRKILLVGVLAIVGLLVYSYGAREREKLRIQHEHEVQLRAVQLIEEQQRQAAAERELQHERQRQLDAAAREYREKEDQERYIREVDRRSREVERAMESQARRAEFDQRQAERQAATKQRREMAEAQYRAQRDKALLQRIERERYGRVLTY